MALIRSMQDAALFVRLNKASNATILPDFVATELLHLVPVIGQALYDKLNTDFASLNVNPSTTDAYVVALRHCQRVVGPLGFARELGSMHSIITDNGVRTPESGQASAAHQWEFNKLRDDLYNKSAEGMELLIRHLFANAGAIAEWNNSDEYKSFSTLAIRTATDFSKYYKLYDPYRTFFLLKPLIADVQDHYIVPIIGRELLKWLLGRDTAIITVQSIEVDMMLHFKKAIVCFTIKHAIKQMAVRITDAGFTVLASGSNDENASGRTQASLNSLDMLTREMENEGQHYLRDLQRFMKGAYNGDFTNDFDASFDTAFDLSPMAPTATREVVLETKNGDRKIFVMGG